ncbi:squalene/phytoene synthase family protein [Corynebacterium sp.]|uniref:phytoene/squalene synthase family protein n=1 Tax=Corynebacterium sp. TaxID=1720 RepID=UPI0026DBE0F7|nr:squalene/phytoene synthase family protein [Corynebacterium sp.]MDO5076062.1 squalene/phytoene synthase family protein [Corynebacterium sp.]
MSEQHHPPALFSAMSERAAAGVMAHYSTSFSLATQLLSPRMRADVRNLYAVVRIADEIVDGAAAGVASTEIAHELTLFRQAVFRGCALGFSSNPIIHAFAATFRRCRIAEAQLESFFDSMERDLGQTTHTAESRADYVYGSAEVIGLMCLAIFTANDPLLPADKPRAESGARALGAAFQNINFLRDLATDRDLLGRTYLTDDQPFDDAAKDAIIAEIRADLRTAYDAIPLLPRAARTGVLTAYYMFDELTRRLEAAPASVVATSRIRVPGTVKAALTARAIAHAPRLGSPR